MKGKILTPEWLTETNSKLADQGIPPNERHQKAHALWWAELQPDVLACGDSEAEYTQLQIEQQRSLAHIESFFLTQGIKRRNSGMIGGPIYRGAFYYLGEFWPFFVPLIMGMRKIRFLERLQVPPDVSSLLQKDAISLKEFSPFCEDCIDYGYAIDEVLSLPLPDVALRFLLSADAHLTATSQMLFMEPKDSKPLLDATMSIEIFCKAFLAAKLNRTEKQLRDKYSHNVNALIHDCIGLGLSDLKKVVALVKTLPNVEERYKTTECVLGELWQAYRASLLVGVTILRALTTRDCRKPINAPR